MAYALFFTSMITLFAMPIFGFLQGFISVQSRLSKFRKMSFLPAMLMFAASTGIFIDFVLFEKLTSVVISVPCMQIFGAAPTLVFNAINSLVMLVISGVFCMLQLGFLAYHRDFVDVSGDFVRSAIEMRKNELRKFSYAAFFALALMTFSSGFMFFFAGMILLSISYVFVNEKALPSKFSLFRSSIIADFVIIFAFIMIITLQPGNSNFASILSGIVFVALIVKLAMPPTNLMKQFKQHEIFIFLSAIVRPALIFLFYQRFSPLFFSGETLGLIIIVFVALIMLKSLFSIYFASISLQIVDNTSVFSVSMLILFSMSSQIENLIIAFLAMSFGIMLQSSILLFLASRNEKMYSDFDDAERFSVVNLGGLREKFSILYVFMVVAILSIAGTLPFVGGWVFFNQFKFSQDNLLSNFAFVIDCIASVFFIFAQVRFITKVFGGGFRGSEKAFELFKLPRKILLLPALLITLILLSGGVFILPGNTEISGILSKLLSTMSQFSGKKITEFDNLIMILMFAVPLLAFIASQMLDRKGNAQIISEKRRIFYDPLFALSRIISRISKKFTTYLEVTADFAYIVVERLIFHTLFTLAGRLIVFVKNILTFNFQSEEQLRKNKARFAITMIVLILLITVIIGVLW